MFPEGVTDQEKRPGKGGWREGRGSFSVRLLCERNCPPPGGRAPLFRGLRGRVVSRGQKKKGVKTRKGGNFPRVKGFSWFVWGPDKKKRPRKSPPIRCWVEGGGGDEGGELKGKGGGAGRTEAVVFSFLQKTFAPRFGGKPVPREKGQKSPREGKRGTEWQGRTFFPVLGSGEKSRTPGIYERALQPADNPARN